MALMNASGEAAMRRTICIGSWTSLRTVETVAMTFDAETRRCISALHTWSGRRRCAGRHSATLSERTLGIASAHFKHASVSAGLPQYCWSFRAWGECVRGAAPLRLFAENVRPQSAGDDIDGRRDRRRHWGADIEAPAFDRIDDAARGQCAQRAGELQSFGEADAMR